MQCPADAPSPPQPDASTTPASRREAIRSFLIPVGIALVLRLASAVEFAVRPDGWTGFAGPPQYWGLFLDDFGWTLALIAPIAWLVYVVVRLRRVRAKLVNLAAITLAVPAAVALFWIDLGEAQARLMLHRTGYDAQVKARAEAPVVVFDWGTTSRLIMGRQKYYLAHLRGAARDQVEAYRHSDLPESAHELDAGDIRSLLADAWRHGDVGERFRLLKLDACRLKVQPLVSGYYYLRDDC